MNKTQNDKYHGVNLSKDMINMFCDLIMSDETTQQVYSLILKHTYFEPNNKDKYGITKKEIESEIMVKSSRKVITSTSNPDGTQNNEIKFVPATTRLSKKSCDNIINFLSGATLIYYTEGNSRKYYQLTQRGLIVASFLRKRNSI